MMHVCFKRSDMCAFGSVVAVEPVSQVITFTVAVMEYNDGREVCSVTHGLGVFVNDEHIHLHAWLCPGVSDNVRDVDLHDSSECICSKKVAQDIFLSRCR